MPNESTIQWLVYLQFLIIEKKNIFDAEREKEWDVNSLSKGAWGQQFQFQATAFARIKAIFLAAHVESIHFRWKCSFSSFVNRILMHQNHYVQIYFWWNFLQNFIKHNIKFLCFGHAIRPLIFVRRCGASTIIQAVIAQRLELMRRHHTHTHSWIWTMSTILSTCQVTQQSIHLNYMLTSEAFSVEFAAYKYYPNDLWWIYINNQEFKP